MFKVLHLTRNLRFEAKRSDPVRLSRKVDFGPPKREVSLVPATKSDHHVRKCAVPPRGTTTRAQSPQAPAAATQIL